MGPQSRASREEMGCGGRPLGARQPPEEGSRRSRTTTEHCSWPWESR
ncbi:uncharacterized protein CTRU02_212510 [Colletotrichum truncatum]|uniref:Uncharacterized protein n=2 Tax=Colletotrichum truncatum TaxID=5467 RepID=A0ACC3YP09_COLTU